MAHDVFISYAKADKKIAETVCAKLEANNIRCWIAPRDMVAGPDWDARIVEAIESSRVLVLVFSTHANESDDVKTELQIAKKNRIPIIPFRIADIEPSTRLKYCLIKVHRINAITRPIGKHIDRLTLEVQKHVKSGKLPPPPPPPTRKWLFLTAGAAAVLLVIVGVYLLQRSRTPEEIVTVVASNPQSREATAGASRTQAPEPDIGFNNSHLQYTNMKRELARIKPPKPSFGVEVWVTDHDLTDRNRVDFKLGEKIQFGVTAERDCYILLINLDSEGNLQIIYPNKYHRYPSKVVRENMPFFIPDERMLGKGFEFGFTAPAGEETVKVIATTSPLDLAALGLDDFKDVFRIIPQEEGIGFVKKVSQMLTSSSSPWSEGMVVVESYEHRTR
ncbi:MAG: TIR domain-containing protein [Thermodesulfobacteriota bacterium]|nr:TIR domain-containing protein [Thermodesulfobacteriota bacterium]